MIRGKTLIDVTDMPYYAHSSIHLPICLFFMNFFRFGKHFELPLLAQSILMILAMMAMVEVCVRVKNQSEIIQSKQHSLKG